jgi:4-amino-4-deoxy-L-arabinose transferase-like glycosyltransferase
VVVAPVLIGHGRYFSMNAFDVLFWAAAIYVLILIFSGGSPRLWLLFGVITGLGLLNKYSIGFLCLGLVAGLLLSPHRKTLLTGWFWLGAIAAGVLFLPHVVWQVANGFRVLVHAMRAHTRTSI